MAAALVVGRGEQAVLAGRLAAANAATDDARREAAWLRGVLDAWHRRFVAPAILVAESDGGGNTEQDDGFNARGDARRRRPGGAAAVAAAAEVAAERWERRALHAETVAAAVKAAAAAAENEVARLHALNMQLRGDEARARTGLDGRLAAAVAAVRRHCDGDVAAARETMAAERDKFKRDVAELMARVASQAAELTDLSARNGELEAAAVQRRLAGLPPATPAAALAAAGAEPGSAAVLGATDATGSTGGDATSAVVAEAAARLAEEKRRLQDMCHGLAVNLRHEAAATATAECECERLVDAVAAARAEAARLQAALDVRTAALAALAATLRQLEAAAYSGRGRCRCSPSRTGGGALVSGEEASDGGSSEEQMGNGEVRERDAPGTAAATTTYVDQDASAAPAGTPSVGQALISAQLAQADLQRRLAAAAVAEVELRRILERRERCIEALRREVGARGGGEPARLRPSAAAGGPTDAVAAAGDGDDSGDGGGDGRAAALRRQVAEQGAVIRRLELALAEATAIGGTAAAVVVAAEDTAAALFGAAGRNNSMAQPAAAAAVAAYCPLCSQLQRQVDEAERRRLAAEAAADDLRARIRRSNGGGWSLLWGSSMLPLPPLRPPPAESEAVGPATGGVARRTKRGRAGASATEDQEQWETGSLDSLPDVLRRHGTRVSEDTAAGGGDGTKASSRDDGRDSSIGCGIIDDGEDDHREHDRACTESGPKVQSLSMDVEALQQQVDRLVSCVAAVAANAGAANAGSGSGGGGGGSATARPGQPAGCRRDSFDLDLAGADLLPWENGAASSTGGGGGDGNNGNSAWNGDVRSLLGRLRPRLAELRRRVTAAEGWESEVLALRTELMRR
ncbi:unnamed protein product, partial [Phaeothamnion confervicola]